MSTQQKFTFLSLAVVIALLFSACATLPALSQRFGQSSKANNSGAVASQQATQPAPQSPATNQSSAAPTTAPTPVVISGETQGLLASYQGVLENVYAQVNPSVVNIRVIIGTTSTNGNNGNNGNGNGNGSGLPFGFGNGNNGNNGNGLPFGFGNGNGQVPQQGGEALGSGFVWDNQGHIVTNNHVVSGATKVEVTFSDDSTYTATVVGTDPNTDLAVIKVDAPANLLKPVIIADGKSVRVGQIAIAIGNPYGLQGTMTVGIVSALGRSISASATTTSSGASYSIPNIIQTDAPINPGNSGGVLLNDLGQLIGVTAAIESSSDSNSGVGFAIPSDTVQNVIPALISTGRYDHPYLGISGTNLTSELATAMNLKSDQRGALVEEVVQGGPADKANLRGSTQQVTIEGQTASVGGDVVTAANGQAIHSMDDLIAYLASSTKVGDKLTLNILRDGKEQKVDVTLVARPSNSQ